MYKVLEGPNNKNYVNVRHIFFKKLVYLDRNYFIRDNEKGGGLNGLEARSPNEISTRNQYLKVLNILSDKIRRNEKQRIFADFEPKRIEDIFLLHIQ